MGGGDDVTDRPARERNDKRPGRLHCCDHAPAMSCLSASQRQWAVRGMSTGRERKDLPAVLLSQRHSCQSSTEHTWSAGVIMDPRKLTIADTSTALRRAEWECLAVELRAKANALIESMLDDEDEIATRQALLDLALLNPVDHQFEVDTELYADSDSRSAT